MFTLQLMETTRKAEKVVINVSKQYFVSWLQEQSVWLHISPLHLQTLLGFGKFH